MALTLRIHLTYHGHLSGQHGSREYASETEPRLTLFLTHGLSGGQTITKRMPASKHHVMTFDVPFYTQAPDAVQEAAATWLLGNAKLDADNVISASASLGINCYVLTNTETGQACESCAGSAYISLFHLLENDQQHNGHKLWLADNTGDDGLIAKAQIHIISAKLVSPAGHHHVDLRFAPVTPTTVLPPSPAGAFVDSKEPQRRMERIIAQSMKTFFGHTALFTGPSIPAGEKTHCPEYRTPRLSLPGGAYAVRLPLELPDAGVFVHFLKIVLWREGMSLDDDIDRLADTLRQQLDRTDDAGPDPAFHVACTFLVRLLTLFANSSVYLNDFVAEDPDKTLMPEATRINIQRRVRASRARNGGRPSADDEKPVTESYKIVRRLLGGDCEDVAYEIFIEAQQLLLVSFDAYMNIGVGRLLVQLQRLLRLYVPLLVLACVTNKKLDLTTRDLPADQAMAHTFPMLVPFVTFAAGLAVDLVPSEAAILRTSQFWRDGERMRRPWHRHLRTLVLEGTAPMDPRAILPFSYWTSPSSAQHDVRVMEAKTAALRRAAEASRLRGISVPILPHVMADTPGHEYALDKRDISNFYKAPVSAYMAVRDKGMCDVAFALESPTHPGKYTYGAHFNVCVFPELVPKLRIVPYNRLDADAMHIINDVLLSLEPEPPLHIAPGNELAATPTAIVDAVRRACRSNRAVSIMTGVFRATNTSSTTVFVMSIRDQDVTTDTLDDLARAVAAIVEQRRPCNIDIMSWRLTEPIVADDDALRVIVHDVRITL